MSGSGTLCVLLPNRTCSRSTCVLPPPAPPAPSPSWIHNLVLLSLSHLLPPPRPLLGAWRLPPAAARDPPRPPHPPGLTGTQASAVHLSQPCSHRAPARVEVRKRHRSTQAHAHACSQQPDRKGVPGQTPGEGRAAGPYDGMLASPKHVANGAARRASRLHGRVSATWFHMCNTPRAGESTPTAAGGVARSGGRGEWERPFHAHRVSL